MFVKKILFSGSMLVVIYSIALQELARALKTDGNDLNPWQVGKILRGIGFNTKLSGGTNYIIIDKTQLLAIAQQLGIDDDVLKQMTP